MNKNKSVTLPMIILMLSGSLPLSGCDNKSAQRSVPRVPEVGIVTLKSAPLVITTELTGRTSPFRVAEVRPQVSGIILKRNFTEGSEVKAGTSLYQIDPASYKARYEIARSNLVKAQAADKLDQLMLTRAQKLVGMHYLKQQDYDTAVANAQQSHAVVVSAKADLETARINLAYTRVISPVSGRIGKSAVTEGALVQNGQITAMATVQQLNPVYVDITQSSSDFLRMKQALINGTLKQENGKANVELMTNDGKDYPQRGTLEFADMTVDKTTGSVTLRAIFPNPNHMLLSGMFVRVRLEEGTCPDALLVPQQAVTRTPDGNASVLLVDADDKVEIREITASQTIGDKWLVTSGLKTGDRVIVTGLQKVKPGVRVKMQEIFAGSQAPATESIHPESLRS